MAHLKVSPCILFTQVTKPGCIHVKEIQIRGCEVCGAGKYRAPGTNSACLDCPEGYTGPEDAVDEEQCWEHIYGSLQCVL